MNNPLLKTNISRTNISQTNISSTNNTYPNNKIITTMITILFICLFIYLIICIIHYLKTKCYDKKDFFKYLFDFSNNDVCIKETEPIPESKKPKPNSTNDILSMIQDKKDEVFHIDNQDYTYEQSKCKCESYGAKLATKAQIVDAYNKGAHWCTYGWTDNKTAYYPVQQCEWNKIKDINDRLNNSKNYCGIPGLNGGPFSNTQLKFGVNCFGKKPKGKINKEKSPYCEPVNFCKLEQNYNASNKLPTDEIIGFNNDKWNM